MSVDLPASREAELGVIGACLDGGIETCVEAFSKLPDRAFYHEDLRYLYQCLDALVRRNVPPDAIALMGEWGRLGCDIPFPLADVATAQDRSAKFLLNDRVGTVLELFQRRRMVMAANSLMTEAANMAISTQEALANHERELSDSRPEAPPVHEPKACADLLINDLENRFQLQGKRSGIPTGLHALDDITDGLQQGEFWVIGARPSVGKTAIALNVAEHVVFKEKKACLFISLEMTAAALLRRMLSMSARINARTIRRGLFDVQDFKSMTTFSARLAQSQFYIMDAPGGAKDTVLCSAIRAAVRRWGVQVVILDYIQKIKPESKGEKRTYEIGDTTGMLVEVAKRENINLFALAQLNRDKDKQCRAPIVSDLADSKAIEADADFIGLLDRPVQDESGQWNEGRARLHVAKQRDGERGMIELEFDGRHHRFTDIAPTYEHRTSTGTNGSGQNGVCNAVERRTPAEV